MLIAAGDGIREGNFYIDIGLLDMIYYSMVTLVVSLNKKQGSQRSLMAGKVAPSVGQLWRPLAANFVSRE